MYNFIVNSIKQINTHMSKKTVNNLGQIKLEKVKKTLKYILINYHQNIGMLVKMY